MTKKLSISHYIRITESVAKFSIIMENRVIYQHLVVQFIILGFLALRLYCSVLETAPILI